MVFFFFFFLGAKSKVLAPQWDIMAKRMSEAVRPSSSLQDEVHELDWALCGTTFTANLSEVRNPHLPVRMLIFNCLCVNSFAVLSNNVVSPKTRKGKTYAYPATPITWDATKVKYKSKKIKAKKASKALVSITTRIQTYRYIALKNSGELLTEGEIWSGNLC